MRRGLIHAMAWSLATGAAVALSWWGVHTVMSGTAYDPPRAVPLTTDRPTLQRAQAQASSTQRPQTVSPSPSSAAPSASASASSSRSDATPSDSPTAKLPASSALPASPKSPSATSTVKSYPVDGGRVAFAIGDTSAELVSATPASGWQMEVWKQPTWIRVTFTRGEREISVFCVWHDTAPRVEIDERRR